MEACVYGILEEIKDARDNLALLAMTKNDIMEELTRVNDCLTDTVHNLQGENSKLINMLGLCKPTSTGTFGDDKHN